MPTLYHIVQILCVLISTYWNVNTSLLAKNILFCKVLISTYWNVNIISNIDNRVAVFSFNLNLLECKYI